MKLLENLNRTRQTRLLFLLVLFLSLPVVFLAARLTQDIRNWAQGTNEVGLRFNPSSGDRVVGSTFSVNINMYKISTRSISVSGAQAVVDVSSKFIINSAACVAPFNGLPFVSISGQRVTVMCAIATGITPVSLPTSDTTFATINLTVAAGSTAGSAPLTFFSTRATEAGVSGTAPDVSTGGVNADFNIVLATTPTLTPTRTPTRTPTPPGVTFTPAPTTPPSSGSITLRGVYSANTTSGGAGSLTFNKPSGTTAGDVMIAQITVGGSATVITPASGWTLIRTDVTSSAIKMSSYYKVATASEPGTYTWGFSVTEQASGGIASYTGVSSSNPINASGGQYNSATANMTAPSISTTVTNARLVFLAGVGNSASIAPPSGMTEHWDVNDGSGATSAVTSEMADQNQSATGATGTRTAIDSVTNGNLAQLIALAPGTSVPPTPGPTTYCTDTDGGLNYTVRGSISGTGSGCSTAGSADLCASSSILNEGHCGPNNECFTDAVPCTLGCSNGACNTTGPSLTPVNCPNGNLGNINCDIAGLINETDLSILISKWYTGSCPAPTPSFSSHRSADLNGDCRVDETDLSTVLRNWRT